MNRRITLTLAIAGLGAVGATLVVGRGETQPTAGKLTIGIYAPGVEFGAAQQRLAYVQGLAKAIESNAGVKIEAQSFASLAALKSAKVDFAIVEGQCVATNLGWKVLAVAEIGGGTSRNYALYASAGGDMRALRGKKLAFVQTGCNDKAFVDNAMLESEIDDSFFAARVGKPDLTAAVAEVASYKTAHAVFAPSGAQKGLTKVFDTGTVPNPAFVQMSSVPASVSEKVAAAVNNYGGGGAITGWAAASKSPYQGLAGRMSRVVKRGVFAAPDPVRIDAKDVLIEPPSIDDPAETSVLHHVARPPERLE